MDKYVCIHGHFYQPPRENAWLEKIELQDEAYPYHDWNERITAECYARNGKSRILDKEGRIIRIINNYSRMSFNFGPTLLSWLEENAPDVYRSIQEADRESLERFSGHGSALAQPYNHLIMPLASRLDKVTQVRWGVEDFRHRFGRDPEGMWLPETAVDLETLDVLAEAGMAFTILAPRQAGRIRPLSGGGWEDVTKTGIDPSRAYKLVLPSGRDLALFFYDGPISTAVAFEKLLHSGENLANRLLGGFSEKRTWPQLIHLATDGETFGHHHPHGDMALAFALDHIETGGKAKITNYGLFLAGHPPTHEVEIIENTSWSCVHGIKRWRADCGCHSGLHPEWNQAWRAPLREALDLLRGSLDPLFESQACQYLKDPWAARNDYVELILDRSPERRDDFLARHAQRALTDEEKVLVLKLLELQRQAMLIYTSCGWFFDDISGIETVQILQYAGRAIQLAREVGGQDLEPGFLRSLEGAKSNKPGQVDGRRIYDNLVRPAFVDLPKVAAHYAVSSLFEEYGEEAPIYCYRAEKLDYRLAEAGRARLALGRVRITSEITGAWGSFSFGVLHFGDHNLNCGVRSFHTQETYSSLIKEIGEAFSKADLPGTLRLLDRHFAASTFSLNSLFRDEQRKILSLLLQSTLEEAEVVYRQLYEYHAPLIRFLNELGTPTPEHLSAAAGLVLNTGLKRALEEEELNQETILMNLEKARLEGVKLDHDTLEFAFRQRLEEEAERLAGEPSDLALLQKLESEVELALSLPFKVNNWQLQNIVWELWVSVFPGIRERAEGGQAEAGEWVSHFKGLAAKLSVLVK